MKYLDICDSDRERGAYPRSAFTGSKIQEYYAYRNVSFSLVGKDYILTDPFCEDEKYRQEVQEFLQGSPQMYAEEIYLGIKKIRERHDFVTKKEQVSLHIDGIDQSDLLKKKLEQNMVIVIGERLENVTHTYHSFEQPFVDPAKIPFDPELQKAIDEQRCLLLVIGEEGLLACRNLKVDSFVIAKATGYETKALVNNHPGTHCVYIPAHFDLTKHVSLRYRSEITFEQLAYLDHLYGESIYQESIPDLYNKYPSVFINIYDSPEHKQLDLVDSSGSFLHRRDETIRNFLASRGVMYYSAYFDENGKRDIPFGQKENGMIVQGVRLPKSKTIRAMDRENGISLRDYVRNKQEDEVCLYTNFLFFMTPKGHYVYNQFRKDRPLEQVEYHMEHLDYKKDPEQESFPLYHKACFAMGKKTELFDLVPTSGTVKLLGHTFSFTEKNINQKNADISIWTPYLSKERKDRVIPIDCPEGMVNIAVIQNRIVCIRADDVLLPSIGIVITVPIDCIASLEKLNNGYYSCAGLTVEFALLDPRLKDASYAYGGGMLLLKDGQKGDLQDEGWLTPLSLQTQDSRVDIPAKHPRTAIGATWNGETVLFVFSGRNDLSEGATYEEMCEVIRQLVPDIKDLMNVDGGASAFLGLSIGSTFMEISEPAPSIDNISGQVRKVISILESEI